MDIIHTPNDVLLKPAKPVAKIDNKIKTIVKDMAGTLKHAANPKGIGLAAPQVGLPLRIFLIKLKKCAALCLY